MLCLNSYQIIFMSHDSLLPMKYPTSLVLEPLTLMHIIYLIVLRISSAEQSIMNIYPIKYSDMINQVLSVFF